MFGLTTLATVAAAALVVPVAAANASAVSAAALALRDSVAGSDDYFIVDFETDVKLDDGSAAVISVNITNSWAPLGAAHFRELVEDKFYDEAAFFRVVPNFVVQFGIAGEPEENTKWKKAIQDDPVVASNTMGTITYATAGPNTRTTQLFINYKDNAFLDKQGFAPLGTVIAGMDVANAIFNPTPSSSGGISQSDYTQKGNSWLKKNYPDTNFIVSAAIRQ